MKYKRVLVTGGTGFIGSHLVEALLRQGRDVRILALPKPFTPIELDNLALIKKKGAEVVYGDLRDIESLKPAANGMQSVFHLGGISRPMKILKREYYDNGVLGTENILKVSHYYDVKKFVHVSSVSVLGVSPDGHPLKEEEFQYEDSDYGLMKRLGERTALEYHWRYKLPVVVIRPSLVYGPRCVVRLIMFKLVRWRMFPLFNEGRAKMEFAYVDNIVDSLLLAEKNEKVIGEIFNVTDGQSYSIKTVLNTIAKKLGVRPPFIKLPLFIGKPAGQVSQFISALIGIYPPFTSMTSDWMANDKNVYDCSKAKEVLGYQPKVSLEEGVKRTIKWFQRRRML